MAEEAPLEHVWVSSGGAKPDHCERCGVPAGPAPSESSAGQRHLDGLKRSGNPLVVEAATEAEALRVEPSA